MGLFGGGNTTTVQKADPWSGQQPYLKDIFGNAESIYNWQMNQPLYQGDFTASASPEQRAAASNVMNWNAGAGTQAANQSLAYGLGNAQQGMNNAYTSGNMLGNMATQNSTGQNIANAGRYANNPYMDQMVNAATTDARRNLTENVLPSIDREAAGSGNSLSSRAGIASGIAERGFQDTVANTSAQLRGDAWSQGLQASQNDANQRLQAAQSLGNLGMSQTQAGLSGMQNASGINAQNAQAGMQAAQLQNAQDQALLDNSLARYDYQMYAPSDYLNAYYGVVGGNSWGGSNRTTQSQPSNPIGSLGSLALGLSALCDRRIKADIVRIGSLACGLPIYSFRYLWEEKGTMRVGPMAQEVREIYPDCVIDIDGILHIKYDEILRRQSLVNNSNAEGVADAESK